MRRHIMIAVIIALVAAKYVSWTVGNMRYHERIEREKQKIIEVVKNNETYLKEYISEGDYSKLPEIEGVLEVKENEIYQTVDFVCSMEGFVSDAEYTGFCYAPHYGYRCLPYFGTVYAEEDLVVDGNRVTYDEKDSDNHWDAELIIDNIWYYHAAF